MSSLGAKNSEIDYNVRRDSGRNSICNSNRNIPGDHKNSIFGKIQEK